MRIGTHDTDEKIFLVAEIGNNHEGRFDVARRLVEAAARTGVDAVKFQTFRAKWFTSNRDEARFKRLTSFELTQGQFRELEALARSLGLWFFSTPLDLESAGFLATFADAMKIASGDNDCQALIAAACKSGKPVIVSSGMTDLADIRAAVTFAREEWKRLGITGELAVLHCVSSYPAPDAEVNLAVLPVLARELGCTIGYSDHTLGIDACLAAAALGARILEKHFTLDHHFSEFRDHQLSADPDEMTDLVRRVRRIETLLGRPEKRRQPCEAAIEPVARRSIVAAGALGAGHVLTPADLTWIRPAGGLRPGEEHRLLGKALKRGVEFGEQITLVDID